MVRPTKKLSSHREKSNGGSGLFFTSSAFAAARSALAVVKSLTKLNLRFMELNLRALEPRTGDVSSLLRELKPHHWQQGQHRRRENPLALSSTLLRDVGRLGCLPLAPLFDFRRRVGKRGARRIINTRHVQHYTRVAKTMTSQPIIKVKATKEEVEVI